MTDRTSGGSRERSPAAILNPLPQQVSRRLDGLLQGDYLGLLPGPGSEAGESREYHSGDDVRRMDWPVTARTNVPHVRLTVADRELETWLGVDLSGSLDFGSGNMAKRDLALSACAAMTYLTSRGGNRIGAVAGRRVFPARREGRVLLHALAQAESGRLPEVLDALNKPPRRRGFVVVVSDFLDPVDSWARALRHLAIRHDVLAIEIVDPRELELPNVGVLELVDPETGVVHEVQTASAPLRERYAQAAAAQRKSIADAVHHAGAKRLQLRTDTDWLRDLVRHVAAQRRLRRR